MLKPNFRIRSLGQAAIDTPMQNYIPADSKHKVYVDESDKLLYENRVEFMENVPLPEQAYLDLAGPRRKIYFDPKKTRVGIVTCGGLCPGLNDVVRGLVLSLWHTYGVRCIYGFKYGYQGFIPKYGHDVIELNPDKVDGWNDFGGTLLGSSRGEQPANEVVDCLERMGISILFTIGGDGTLRGAKLIVDEIDRRGLKIAVVGIPKTIDNDIPYIDQSFGFVTAYTEAVSVLQGAHAESKGSPNGVGLVKLMGRSSGFIACHAALAMSEVNICLIPEVPFSLEGEHGFLAVLEKRLKTRKHAVVVVAEGAGQELLGLSDEVDKSGNVKFKDIGVFLRDEINKHFAKINTEVNVKYFDPSYLIRSVPASPFDGIYCMRLSQNAVHAAMSGLTSVMVGHWRGEFVLVPMEVVVSAEAKRVDPNGSLWTSVVIATGYIPK